MKRPPRLQPLGAHLPGGQSEARLRQAWGFVVGPALASRTRLLRVERDVLVLGCWDLARIGPLREAAAAAWPDTRERIRRALGLTLMGLQVVPCDPPPEPSAQAEPQDPDPLRGALLLLEARRKERQGRGLA